MKMFRKAYAHRKNIGEMYYWKGRGTVVQKWFKGNHGLMKVKKNQYGWGERFGILSKLNNRCDVSPSNSF